MMLLVCLLGLTANHCALCLFFGVIINTHTAIYFQSHNIDVPREIHFCLFIRYSLFLSHAKAAVIFTPLSSPWPLKFVNSEKRFFRRTVWIPSLSAPQLLPFPSCADDWISVVLEHCSSANPSPCSSVLWKLISARSSYQHLWLQVLGRARLGLPSDPRDPFYPKPLTSSPLLFLSCTVMCS